MINPLTGAYASLIKFGIVLTLVLSLYGGYKYKIYEAVQKAENVVELRHNAETFRQKEILLDKAQTEKNKLQLSFDTRQKENDAKIKTLNSDVNTLLISLRNRPERPSSVSRSSASTSSTEGQSGATGKELYEPDARFLVGIASEAETLKLGLIQCYSDYQAIKTSIESFTDKK